MALYSITPEAARHLRELARWSADRWGLAQARSYLEDSKVVLDQRLQRGRRLFPKDHD